MQIERIMQSIDTDPAHAIGTAKEMIETTCKSILTARGETYTRKADVPDLIKQTRKVLKLLSEDVPDSARGADITWNRGGTISCHDTSRVLDSAQ
jgi:hypothetical protein